MDMKSSKKNAFAKCKKLKEFNLHGAYAEIKVDKKAFNKDKKVISVRTYSKNNWSKKFAKAIHSKGGAKKETKLKLGAKIEASTDETAIQKASSSKKSSKKSKK